ncbi:pyridoxamine 5'-phosphate oxidase family protein [Nocardiopsis sediminis]|uniref:Pyridoxamine 5'-phosphate oxidase family protein n=1 Tax=Nocardiopsis sediminis TaxID=1778267 RepID=A0ABV8FWZ3_9ACTN
MPENAPTGAGNRRAQIRLSPDEVAGFLGGHRKVQVATIGRHGEPHLSTLFYAMVDGRLAFWTYAASQKAVNLRRDDRITCLVDDGDAYDELRGVVLYGRAELRTDPESVLRVGTAVTAAMTGAAPESLATPDMQAGLAHSGRKRVAVLVTVERTASWDHGKL